MKSNGNLFLELGVFRFGKAQQERFKSGELWAEWARKYPEIFDERDLDLVRTQAPGGTHFYEWLAAIVVLNATGYLSLVEKYESPSHPRKYEIFCSCIDKELLELVHDYDTFGGTQCPDLFVYSRDKRDWFFCEVKGQGDRLSPTQRQYFEALAELSGKPIRTLQFKLDRSLSFHQLPA